MAGPRERPSGRSPSMAWTPPVSTAAWPGSPSPFAWLPAYRPGCGGCGWHSESTIWPDRRVVSPFAGGGRRRSTRFPHWSPWRPAGVSLRWPVAGVVTACVAAAGPLGLTLRGRTSPLAWTRRLRRLAVAAALVEVVVVVLGVVTGLAAPLAVVAVVVVPLAVDLACWVTAPLERRMSAHFVDEATARLKAGRPDRRCGHRVVREDIDEVPHRPPGRRHPDVVVTPASFNNRAGLARAINEQLADGTEVFVAEMGTYGPGEIADLCRWCPPDIAVITAIGPVHLERFGSEDRIVEAKAEIIVPADDVVLPSDDARLGALADRALNEGKRVLRCSTVDRSAGVFVGRITGAGRRRKPCFRLRSWIGTGR